MSRVRSIRGHLTQAAADQGRMVALSIRQPWAWLIVHGPKDVENRGWRTLFRGRILVHASLGMTRAEYEEAKICAAFNAVQIPSFGDLERGGIVGEATLTDCVQESSSPWFFGPYGLVLEDRRPLPFAPCRGMLGFFTPGMHERRAEILPQGSGTGGHPEQASSCAGREGNGKCCPLNNAMNSTPTGETGNMGAPAVATATVGIRF